MIEGRTFRGVKNGRGSSSSSNGPRGASSSTREVETDDKNIYTGKFRWFDFAKGYGFLTDEENDSGSDIFVHITALPDDLVSLLRERTLSKEPLTSIVVNYGKSTPKPNGMRGTRRNADKPSAVNVVLVSAGDGGSSHDSRRSGGRQSQHRAAVDLDGGDADGFDSVSDFEDDDSAQ